MESLEQIIRQALQLFTETYGWNIAIFDPHGVLREVRDFSSYFSNYTIHDNSYCMQIKQDQKLWRRCILCKWKALTTLQRHKAPFYGECFFGVGEYAYPVMLYKRLVAYISVYGYRCGGSPKRLHHLLSERLPISYDSLSALYEKALLPAPDSLGTMQTALSLLAYLLGQLMLKYQPDFKRLIVDDLPQSSQLPLVQAIGYIDNMYANQIKLSDIAAFCHISESHLQHLFKKAYGCGPYEMLLQRRLANACHLLANTELSVCTIALKVGFSDPNYFSYAFHRRFAMTCLQYRHHAKELRHKLV